jgi:hypothetical protein
VLDDLTLDDLRRRVTTKVIVEVMRTRVASTGNATAAPLRAKPVLE